MIFPKNSHIILLLMLAGLAVQSCQPPESKHKAKILPKNWLGSVTGNFSAQSKTTFDSSRFTPFFNSYPDLKIYETQVRAFYANRKFSYAWFDEGRLIEQADNLANQIVHLKDDGIYKTLPYPGVLDSLLDGKNTGPDKAHPDITLELMLTSQYFGFSTLAWQGMSKAAVDSTGWYVPRKKVAYDAYLDSILKIPVKSFASTVPVYRQYGLLRKFLRKYRALDAAGGLPVVNNTIVSLRPGDTSADLIKLKSALFRLGDFQGDTLDHTFDPALVSSLRLFQACNGLDTTGRFNKATATALTVPLKTRIRQIVVNMERSRWLPVSLTSDYIAVNIPEYKLHVYHADSLLWSCNVVVGQTFDQTSIFYGNVKYVVFRPYWNVPPSIVRAEILPGMRKNRHYLKRHHMEITGHSDGLPVVRQKPGPNNSLGLVKFLFPNSFNIYLHDTPAKSLFQESSRDFSHGCIRVMKPAKLAAFLLKDNEKWTPAAINKAMHTGGQQYVTLKNKIPVFIAYFTAFVDRNGALNFRKDIYNLDDHLANMLIAENGH
jgi:murein L,D-transpeptidase YcbB/YkuD